MVALLRGINLGPRNRVAMPGLRELLTQLGYEDVATVVASGNIVLTTTEKPAALEQSLQKAVAERFDVDTPVLVRTKAQWKKVVADNPLPEAIDDPKRFEVYFCRDEVSVPDFPDDEPVVARGREIYAWHREGIQRSKVAAALSDKKLQTVVTARNWNTILKLEALL